MRIFVSNLAFQVTADDLKQFFIAYDKVESAFIITDRASGKSKGFGYVDITPDSEAKAAIEELNGRLLQERPVLLKVALPPGEKKEGPVRTPRQPGARSPSANGPKPGAPGRKTHPGKSSHGSPGVKPGTGAEKPGGRAGQGPGKPRPTTGGRVRRKRV